MGSQFNSAQSERTFLRLQRYKKKCRITQSDVDQLNAYTRNLAGPNVSINAKIFIVAAGADTKLLPDDMEIIFLRSFSCN